MKMLREIVDSGVIPAGVEDSCEHADRVGFSLGMLDASER